MFAVGVALAPAATVATWQKPVVTVEIRHEERNIASSLPALWELSDLVVEGTIAGESPADFGRPPTIQNVHTVFAVRVLTVYKASGVAPAPQALIDVRLRGGTRELAERVIKYVPVDVPLLTGGGRYIMFLRAREWPEGHSGHSDFHYFGATYSGPDSFYLVSGPAPSTAARTRVADSIAAMSVDSLRAELRRLGGGR
jgi:hypothetical protein